MKVTVLGCGSSLGVPAAGGFWGRCDPKEPRNSRTRASVMVEDKGARLIVDAGYDLRLQINRHGVNDVDALLLSHAHSDHINGLDDLRAIAYNHEKMIPAYCDAETLGMLRRQLPYLFDSGPHKVYTPFIEPHVIPQRGRFTAAGIEVESFAQGHLVCDSLGFRFGDVAYSVDVVELDTESLEALKGVETWIVDGGAYHKERLTTHASLKRVMEWVEIVKPKMTYLTVLTSHMDYKTLCDELPPHVRPAWDGLEIEPGTNRG
jgi:phosphoribosyl 1,2-cyclic phosphate phosphodiesterase